MIFQTQALRSKSLLQRIFRQEPSENALIELNNLLAASLKVDACQLRVIEQKYQLKLAERFPLNLQEFYAVRWNDWIKTGNSDLPIEQELNHWANLFGLNASTTDQLIQLVGEAWYRNKMQQVLQKKQVTPKDEGDLHMIAEHVRLKTQTAEKIFKAARLEIIEAAAAPSLKRERLSPSDENQLSQLAADLRLNQNALQTFHTKLEPYKYYWQLENLPLQAITTSGQLQKSEQCYFEAKQVRWLETRAAGKGYSHLEQVNYGTLYLTNKRLVFEGNTKNSTLPYDRIRNIRQLSEGIEIQKDKGKNPILNFSTDTTALMVIFKRLLNNNP